MLGLFFQTTILGKISWGGCTTLRFLIINNLAQCVQQWFLPCALIPLSPTFQCAEHIEQLTSKTLL